jgi:tRNA(fMet)-specific endonuclease VapC
MTRHLLDSDTVIDALNGFAPTLALLQRLTRQGDTLCRCAIVTTEVYAGLSPAERSRADAFLSSLESLPTTDTAAVQAGIWRYDFARTGITLATTDCLIAAIAAEQGTTVVTGNRRHFPMPDVTVVPLPRR